MLRSDAWIVGEDEAALEHRAALRAAGLEIDPAGGIPVEFPVISLGEDLMMPTAMLYRNLLAIEIEEMTRSHPVDGLILLANCDKTVPGALMGAASANLPTLVITGGARPPARFRGRRLGTGTDLWRLWDERRAGRLDDAGWREAEQALSCGQGACNTMGTASTMGSWPRRWASPCLAARPSRRGTSGPSPRPRPRGSGLWRWSAPMPAPRRCAGRPRFATPSASSTPSEAPPTR